MQGWIKLHRKIIDWGWYKKPQVKSLFIHLLICARHSAGECYGRKLHPGQLITSYSSLSRETGLSVQQVRTALKKLKSTNDIQRQTTTEYTIITITNWDEYQAEVIQVTHTQQADNARLITNNNVNNLKECRKGREDSAHGPHLNVFLSEQEYAQLKDQMIDVDEYITKLSSYMASKGVQYRDHYATILKWHREDREAENVSKKEASPDPAFLEVPKFII